jgi:lectin, mannose-binding 2
VLIDPTNSGTWTECATSDLNSLPSDWLTKAFVGLTASTGQLADNHDVLSLQSFSDYEVMEKAEEAKKKEKAFAPGDKDSLDIRLAKYSSPPSLPCCSSPSLPLLQNGSSDQ